MDAGALGRELVRQRELQPAEYPHPEHRRVQRADAVEHLPPVDAGFPQHAQVVRVLGPAVQQVAEGDDVGRRVRVGRVAVVGAEDGPPAGRGPRAGVGVPRVGVGVVRLAAGREGDAVLRVGPRRGRRGVHLNRPDERQPGRAADAAQGLADQHRRGRDGRPVRVRDAHRGRGPFQGGAQLPGERADARGRAVRGQRVQRVPGVEVSREDGVGVGERPGLHGGLPAVRDCQLRELAGHRVPPGGDQVRGSRPRCRISASVCLSAAIRRPSYCRI